MDRATFSTNGSRNLGVAAVYRIAMDIDSFLTRGVYLTSGYHVILPSVSFSPIMCLFFVIKSSKKKLLELGISVQSYNGDLLGYAFTTFEAYWGKCLHMQMEPVSHLPPWRLVPAADRFHFWVEQLRSVQLRNWVRKLKNLAVPCLEEDGPPVVAMLIRLYCGQKKRTQRKESVTQFLRSIGLRKYSQIIIEQLKYFPWNANQVHFNYLLYVIGAANSHVRSIFSQASIFIFKIAHTKGSKFIEEERPQPYIYCTMIIVPNQNASLSRSVNLLTSSSHGKHKLKWKRVQAKMLEMDKKHCLPSGNCFYRKYW
ncbi:hypothetical protein SADUNF_Sadunf08G0137000 [Salix dunnii]|uniref:Uncharacterized protein n=1 Tax=Salix dunnii TaxID=1413687 RepID=A0A835MSZ2_9ROSI|nr:hypothetical protein SADUNF_Sadunf08G0137000 [Salix dunnii]